MAAIPGCFDSPQEIRRDMKAVLQTWQLLLLILAGWINRHQQYVLEYLCAENQVLKAKLGKKRILLSDDREKPSGRGQPTD